MIHKKKENDEPYAAVTTEAEFHEALKRGRAVELTRELADELGLMEDETISESEAEAARDDPAN